MEAAASTTTATGQNTPPSTGECSAAPSGRSSPSAAGGIIVANPSRNAPDDAAISTHDGSADEDDFGAHDDSGSDDAVKAEGSNETPDPSAPGATSAPVQKRRRVTQCTYDKPSNRRRNPAPQYIEALESRLQRAETLLRKFMPDVDLADPKLDPTVQQEFANRERARAKAAAASGAEKAKKEEPVVDGEATKKQEDQLLSMIESIGHLDLIDGNEWDFHGNSSGAVFLKRLKEQMGLLNSDTKAPFLPRKSRYTGMFSLDSPPSFASSPWDTSTGSDAGAAVPAMYELPPKDVAQNLCYFSLNCATCLLRIVHIPSFNDMVEKLYEKQPENLGPEDHRALGLLNAVMALGSMYTGSDDAGSQQVHYKAAIEKGLKYYTNARMLLQDITECRDLVSLQALLFMILFLQATSNLSGCYAFLGIALRAALRMGLHRHLPHVQLTPIEDESRRRVFYAIRCMDTYVSALLGFPILLQDTDIDQPLPTEVDDEYITKDAILKPPPGKTSFFEAMNAHVRLMKILAKIIKDIYPMRGMDESVMKKRTSGVNATYMISYSAIKAIELELQQWYEQLPINWRPSPEGPSEVIRLSAGKHVDERYYACAAACISVSRNIIHIGMEIRKQAVLTGPYWFILYTEFFAILSLAFYALENPDKAGIPEILADAHAGRELISGLSRMSLAADRVTDALNALFDQLPERLTMNKDPKARPIPTKKRSAPGADSASLLTQEQMAIAAQLKADRSLNGRGRGKIRGTGRAASEAHLPHRISMDSPHQAHQAIGTRAGSQGPFVANYSEPMPLDLLNQSPDNFKQRHQQQTDAMMFPSGDPFAYPNSQPGVGYRNGGHTQDSMPFYMHQVYDDIEGQLLGQTIPPYLMQPGHQGVSGMAAGDLAQMYNASSLVAMQQQQQQRQQQLGPGLQPGHHRHQQDIDDIMLSNTNSFEMFSAPQYRAI
ncbi:activator of stress genes [Pyricularia oryzae Y34]|uniref:Activator of stress genes n=2 Tax=Pyricularia oryzae TaxID=318829 RepID=A0AA97NWV5_PYRO3|nr:activator of stress genes [Pyricularia oryzae Y34]